MVAPIFVGRDKTKRAIERAIATDGRILMVTQRRSADDDPGWDDLYSVGVLASVIHNATLLDGTLKLFISGHERHAIARPVEQSFLAAEVTALEELAATRPKRWCCFARCSRPTSAGPMSISPACLRGRKRRLRLPSMEEPGALADAIAPLLPIAIEQKQQLLETADVVARLEAILELMKSSRHAA